jgi:hypothetical protein
MIAAWHVPNAVNFEIEEEDRLSAAARNKVRTKIEFEYIAGCGVFNKTQACLILDGRSSLLTLLIAITAKFCAGCAIVGRCSGALTAGRDQHAFARTGEARMPFFPQSHLSQENRVCA